MLIPWKELGLLVAGGMLASVGYIAKRWVEGKSSSEIIERKTKALVLHSSLKDAGISLSELELFEAELTRRRQVEDEVTAELHESLQAVAPEETQAGMNRIAGADLQIANAMLEKALTEAEMQGDGAYAKQLNDSQKRWKAYAESEAAYRAAIFEGGTVYPTIHLTELEQLTVRRIADLRAHVKWLKSL